MPKDPRDSSKNKKLDVLKRPKLKAEEFSREFSHEERMTNEVASSEYMGGGKGGADLKNDKSETGGY